MKCVFPIAGYGTRFLPITKVIPKEMLPIMSKPLVEYAIDEALDANIDSMIMVINEQKELIRDYFASNSYLDEHLRNKKNPLIDLNQKISACKFIFTYQKNMLGLGNAIFQAKKFCRTDRFAVILPDDLCFNDNSNVLKQMRDLSNLYPKHCIIAIEEVSSNDVEKYGIIDGKVDKFRKDIFHVENLIEKPSPAEAPSNLAIIGRYLLTPDIFTAIENISADNNGEIQITDALLELARKGRVIAYKFKGKRFDCGSPKGFNQAIRYIESGRQVIE